MAPFYISPPSSQGHDYSAGPVALSDQAGPELVAGRGAGNVVVLSPQPAPRQGDIRAALSGRRCQCEYRYTVYT